MVTDHCLTQIKFCIFTPVSHIDFGNLFISGVVRHIDTVGRYIGKIPVSMALSRIGDMVLRPISKTFSSRKCMVIITPGHIYLVPTHLCRYNIVSSEKSRTLPFLDIKLTIAQRDYNAGETKINVFFGVHINLS